MEKEYSFVFFLEQHPELLSIASSEKHMRCLSLIATGIGSSEGIAKEMPSQTLANVEKIILDLSAQNLVSETAESGKKQFCATPAGIDFLQRHAKASKHFSIR